LKAIFTKDLYHITEIIHLKPVTHLLKNSNNQDINGVFNAEEMSAVILSEWCIGQNVMLT